MHTVTSPDGSEILCLAEVEGSLLVGTRAGKLHRLDSVLMHSVQPAVSLPGSILALAWNPVWRVMAVAAHESKAVSILPLTLEGRPGTPRMLPTLEPDTLAWSPDGGWLVAAGPAPTFYSIPCEGGIFGEPLAMKVKMMVSGAAFTPDGHLRTLDTMEGLIDWNAATGQRIGPARKLQSAYFHGVFNKDASRVTGFRQSLYSYQMNAVTGKLIGDAYSSAFTQAGGISLGDDRLLVYGQGGQAQVVRQRQDTPQRAIFIQEKPWPDFSALSSDGRYLLTGGTSSPRVQVWDLRERRMAERPIDFPVESMAVSFAEKDGKIIILGRDGYIYQMDRAHPVQSRRSALPVMRSFGKKELASGVFRFSPGGKWLTLQQGTQCKFVDVAAGEVLLTLEDEGDGFTALTWLENDAQLVLGRRSGKLTFHRFDGGKLTKSSLPDIHLNEAAYEVALAPGGKRLAVLSTADNVSFQDLETGQEYGSTFYAGAGMNGLTWSADGSTIACGDVEGNVVIWDVLAGLRVGVLPRTGGSFHTCLNTGTSSMYVLANNSISEIPLLPPGPIPEWVPDLLEALAGKRVVEQGKGFTDPDDWMVPLGKARRDTHPGWPEMARWLFDFSSQRTAAPGIPMAETQVIAALEKDHQRENIITSCREIQEMWNSSEPARMQQAKEKLETLIRIHPEETDLRGARLTMATHERDAAAARDCFLGWAASPEAPLLEVLMCKTEAARMELILDHPDTALARRLLDEVLAACPGEERALELYKELK